MSTSSETLPQRMIFLPRGGVLVRAAAGAIQFGVPPETIKDTLPMRGGVPDTFVLTRRVFDVERGISMAELEFPIYYNLFLKRRKVHVICEPHQKDVVTTLLQETLMPPPPAALEREYAGGKDDPALPDLAAELRYFQRHPRHRGQLLQLSDVIEFHDLPKDGVRLGDVRIVLRKSEDAFHVTEGNRLLAELPWDLPIPPLSLTVKSGDPYVPPMFGVTALGTGSGFDPTTHTSGFIVWVNRRGIMVDPPVDATLNLRAERIHPKLVQDVILTHYHADHDAGLLQKVLDEGIIRIHTTPTIMEGFLRKATILTGLASDELRSMIEFQPVTIGEPASILGARFRFWYTLHSIPTIGFEAELSGKRLVYSSDHLNVPATHKKLLAEGVLSPGRYEDLQRFPWDADLVIHEAGIPPLHTPPGVLDRCPEDVKKRLVLVHTVEARVRPFSDLRMMGHGIDNTLTLDVPEGSLAEHYQLIKAVASVDFLRDLPLDRAADVLHIARRHRISAGRHLIRRGEKGEELYIILHGEVGVVLEGQPMKVYGSGDIVGDMALVSDAPRFADVVTISPVTYLSISKVDLLAFLNRTGVLDHLRHLAEMRREESWPVLEACRLLDLLTPSQLTQLHALLRHARLAPGEVLPQPGDAPPFLFVLASGRMEARRGRGRATSFHGSSCVGWIPDGPSEVTYEATEPTTGYKVSGPRLRRFLQRNPGASLRLAHRLACQLELRD